MSNEAKSSRGQNDPLNQSAEKKVLLKLDLNGDSSWLVARNLDEMLEILKYELQNMMDQHVLGSDENDFFRIDTVEMTDEELKNLGEWDGW